jgi:pyrroline-5-carboxylate reductase
MSDNISIIGGGNLGSSIALGLIRSRAYKPENIFVTRRRPERMKNLTEKGIQTGRDNIEAIINSEIVILAVQPTQMEGLLKEIKAAIPDETTLVSVVSAFSINNIEAITGKGPNIVRAMPNVAIALGESITCLAVNGVKNVSFRKVEKLFNKLGQTLMIDESLMAASTILGASGIAFFLRMIRAVSQGGIQLGFHAEEAQMIAAQTAKGAASILIKSGNHPESEIDKVTTPRGLTITGLNEMEHNGLSSSLIKGIITSYKEIENLKK